jgi:ATP-dependent DNA ligase
MLSRPPTLPTGFVPPCLPTKAPSPPAGDDEIKHDGFRVIARKDGPRVQLYSRPGNDLTQRFALIVEALARLRASSCIIDGEAVACGDDGISSFNLLRYRRRDDAVFLYAFDLIELAGDDRRRDPLEQRKLDLGRLLAKAGPGVRLNEWIDGGEHDGRDHVLSRLQTWARRHSKQTEGVALPLWPLARLAQDEESGLRGGEAGGGRGLGAVSPLKQRGTHG